MAFTFPPAALAWLLEGCGPSLLVLADSLAVPRLLVRHGFVVCAIHPDAWRLRGAIGAAGISLAAARVEALPFGDCRFDGVFVHQVFSAVAPGLPEIARVLRPNGCLAISHLGRDDTVPWVRKLAQLMHSVDSQAMSAPSSDKILAPAQQSKYFHGSLRDFRMWQTTSRDGMIDMVAATPAVQILDPIRRKRLLDAAAEIHDQAAGNNQLRLPYQLGCWRGQVDQEELTHPVQADVSGLIISL